MDFFGILYDIKNGKKVPYRKTYFDTLFAAKLAEMQIKTLTGTLPLTFRTSETALRSWTIYGNDFQQEESKGAHLPLSFYTDEDKLRDWTIYGNNTQHNYSAEGTLPLTFTTQTAGHADDWSISGNDNVGKNLLQITTGTFTDHGVTFTFDAETGIVVANGKATGGQGRYAFYITPTETLNLYLSGCSEGGSASTYNIYPWDSTTGARPKKWDGVTAQTDSDYGTGGLEVQAAAGHRLSATIRIEEGYTADNLVFKPMYRLSDTSATFEPYQIGVGQRTKNKLEITATTQEINGVTFTIDKQAGTITANGTATSDARLDFITDTMFVNATDVINGIPDNATANTYYILAEFENGANAFGSNLNETEIGTRPNFSQKVINWRIYIKSGITVNNLVFKPMLRPAGTSADFVPFGYEIPLNVNSTPQDIYIGGTPLTAGQSVSKTSTGIDIAAQAGSNTITTELYNKPEMSIEGVDYVGVGEYVNDSWQIPLTVSDGTNTTTVNVPIDAPLTASDTATKASTGVDIATADGTNTISTTLYNKPEMLVYYGYKGAGVHNGDTWEFNFITQANGNQQLTKITMDKPLRAGETLTSEQAGVTIPTYADAENTLSLYPNAAGYGNPEMSITYKGG